MPTLPFPDDPRLEVERDSVLASYASDVVLIVDAEARVAYLSPSAERLMGYRAEEWLNRNAVEVIHPDDAELAAGAFGRALANPGVNEPLEVRVRQVGGGWRWYEIVATNLLEHPAIRGVVLSRGTSPSESKRTRTCGITSAASRPCWPISRTW